jgi:hypothetical protein
MDKVETLEEFYKRNSISCLVTFAMRSGTEELNEIENSSKIKVQGESYPEQLQKVCRSLSISPEDEVCESGKSMS